MNHSMFRCLSKEIIRKIFYPYHVFMKCYLRSSSNLTSALYIGLEQKGTVFSSLDPYVDFDKAFEDIDKLKTDLGHRNMEMDVDYLHKQSILYQRLAEVIKSTKAEIQSFLVELRESKVKVENLGNDSAKNCISLQISEAKEKLKIAQQEFISLEKNFILPFLNLPASLHKNTTVQDEDMFSLFPKPEFSFKPKSHIEIGAIRDQIDFKNVSPTSFYLKGDLALLEFAVSEFILSRFQEHGFKNRSNMDLCQAALLEGCGVNLNLENQLKIEDLKCTAFNQTTYLLGGASLPSFVAAFCKGVVTNIGDSVIRLVSIGRKYNALNATHLKANSLFTTIQSTGVSGCVFYPNDIGEEALVNEVAMLVTQICTELGLHFKLIQYGAPKLRTYEALAVGISMYSPYFKTYIEIGRISVCQDYISKRLQIFQGLGKDKATFLSLIYVDIMDVTKWIGCAIENTQTEDGTYSIPNCVQSFMYGKV